MESSKFWKLRRIWFRLKRWVGLGMNERAQYVAGRSVLTVPQLMPRQMSSSAVRITSELTQYIIIGYCLPLS